MFFLTTQRCSAKQFTHYTIFTPPIFWFDSLFITCGHLLLRRTNSKQGRPASRVKDILVLPPVGASAVPVTTDAGGTSQVNVTMVPSSFGNKLESEIAGSGERGTGEGDQRGQGRVNQDWRALSEEKERPQGLFKLSIRGPFVPFYSAKASKTCN